MVIARHWGQSSGICGAGSTGRNKLINYAQDEYDDYISERPTMSEWTPSVGLFIFGVLTAQLFKKSRFLPSDKEYITPANLAVN